MALSPLRAASAAAEEARLLLLEGCPARPPGGRLAQPRGGRRNLLEEALSLAEDEPDATAGRGGLCLRSLQAELERLGALLDRHAARAAEESVAMLERCRGMARQHKGAEQAIADLAARLDREASERRLVETAGAEMQRRLQAVERLCGSAGSPLPLPMGDRPSPPDPAAGFVVAEPSWKGTSRLDGLLEEHAGARREAELDAEQLRERLEAVEKACQGVDRLGSLLEEHAGARREEERAAAELRARLEAVERACQGGGLRELEGHVSAMVSQEAERAMSGVSARLQLLEQACADTARMSEAQSIQGDALSSGLVRFAEAIAELRGRLGDAGPEPPGWLEHAVGAEAPWPARAPSDDEFTGARSPEAWPAEGAEWLEQAWPAAPRAGQRGAPGAERSPAEAATKEAAPPPAEGEAAPAACRRLQAEGECVAGPLGAAAAWQPGWLTRAVGSAGEVLPAEGRQARPEELAGLGGRGGPPEAAAAAGGSPRARARLRALEGEVSGLGEQLRLLLQEAGGEGGWGARLREHEVRLASLRLAVEMADSQWSSALERVGKDWDERFRRLGHGLQELGCDRLAASERLEALARWAQTADQALAELRGGPASCLGLAAPAEPVAALRFAAPAAPASPAFGAGGPAAPRDRSPRATPAALSGGAAPPHRPSLDAGASSREPPAPAAACG